MMAFTFDMASRSIDKQWWHYAQYFAVMIGTPLLAISLALFIALRPDPPAITIGCTEGASIPATIAIKSDVEWDIVNAYCLFNNGEFDDQAQHWIDLRRQSFDTFYGPFIETYAPNIGDSLADKTGTEIAATVRQTISPTPLADFNETELAPAIENGAGVAGALWGLGRTQHFNELAWNVNYETDGVLAIDSCTPFSESKAAQLWCIYRGTIPPVNEIDKLETKLETTDFGVVYGQFVAGSLENQTLRPSLAAANPTDTLADYLETAGVTGENNDRVAEIDQLDQLDLFGKILLLYGPQ